ncbi:hypothetical protein IWQ55_006401 [Labrenzia sp. EL_208]|nr:hypothetical protein [Labrenzia sp. EL_132]MBG6233166.1 hypothetical protein [Labrenzia sp. EL_208]
MDMGRKKIPLNLAIDPELSKALDDWIGKQELKPSKTAVLELALKEFLEKRGGKGGS